MVYGCHRCILLSSSLYRLRQVVCSDTLHSYSCLLAVWPLTDGWRWSLLGLKLGSLLGLLPLGLLGSLCLLGLLVLGQLGSRSSSSYLL